MTERTNPAGRAPEVSGFAGNRFGKYRIEKLLGKGGMGAVYAAVDERLNRRVALKVLLPDLAAEENANARLLREARAAAAVESDHVVKVYEVDEIDGVPYIALQFLHGSPLDEHLKRNGDPDLATAVRLCRETALGLAAAHAEGLVHRDIKPGNVWLEAPDGRVKVLDFGLAKPVNALADTNVTATGAIVGTPTYMSPEQARGIEVDARTDLWSLGVMLYRLSTGALPFTGPNGLAVLAAIAADEPPPAHELNPKVPPALAGLVSRLLAKTPAHRPATALEVADELGAIERALRAPPPPVVVQLPASPFDDLDATEADERTVPAVREDDRAAPPQSRAVWWALGAVALAAVVVAALVALPGKPREAVRAEPPPAPPKPKSEPEPNPKQPAPKLADHFEALARPEIVQRLTGPRAEPATWLDGSDHAGNQLTPGTVVLYRTGGNRYGKFQVRQSGYTLLLRWVTYADDGAVLTSGEDLTVNGTCSLDLELGKQADPTGRRDFFWNMVGKVARKLEATDANVRCLALTAALQPKPPVPLEKVFDAVGYTDVASAHANGTGARNARLYVPHSDPYEAVLLFHTPKGFGKVLVRRAGANLSAQWVLYNDDRSVRLERRDVEVKPYHSCALDGAGPSFWWATPNRGPPYIDFEHSGTAVAVHAPPLPQPSSKPDLKARNPFGLKDLENELPASALRLAERTKLPLDGTDPNADLWFGKRRFVRPTGADIDGEWASRWRAPGGEWKNGTATIKTVGEKVFVSYREPSQVLIELTREGDKLVGAYHQISNLFVWPVVAFVVSDSRIDGVLGDGSDGPPKRWDFRRSPIAPNP